MKKLKERIQSYSLVELADLLVQTTVEYSDLYFKSLDKKEMDKQLWAALRVGFVTALKIDGYSESAIDTVLDIAQEKLMEIQDEKKV